MKFTVPKEDLINAINIVIRAVSVNNTLPVLSNIFIKAEGTKLYFESTNLEIAIKYSLKADIHNEGEITIPAKLFQSYISLLKDEEVSINTTDGNTININSSNSNTQIKGMSSKDFPKFTNIEKVAGTTINSQKLAESVSQVAFAASVSAIRPMLSGVLIHGEKNILKLVATDSFRLSEKKISLKNEIDNTFKIIVPAKTMQEMARIAHEDIEAEINMIISENQILFKVNNIELFSRLIDGQFPNHEQVIPSGDNSTVVVEKADLLQNIKRVGLFAKENNNNIKLIFDSENQKLQITTDATQIGMEDSYLQAKIEGPENKIALNADYIVDVLNSLPSGNIRLSVYDKLAPAVIKHEKLNDFVHIIMPLKL